MQEGQAVMVVSAHARRTDVDSSEKSQAFFPVGETWRYLEADLPPAVRVLEAMLKEINPPWLSFAGDLLVSPVNPLFSLVVANDPQ